MQMRHPAVKHNSGDRIDIEADPSVLYCYGHVDSLRDVSIDCLDQLIHLKRKHNIWSAADAPKLIDIVGDKFSVEHLMGRFVPSTDGEGYMNLIEYQLGNSGYGVFPLTIITVDAESAALIAEYDRLHRGDLNNT